MQQTTFQHFKTHVNELCQHIIEDQDMLLVTQENADNLIILSQSLFDAWQETLYLLKSPANRAMLEKSIAEHQNGQTFTRVLIHVEND